MQRKLTRSEFTTLAGRYEDIKRKRKVLQEWQERQDIQAIQQGRADRIYKKSRIMI